MTTYTIFTDELKSVTKKIQHIISKCDKHNISYEFSVGDSYAKVVAVDGTNYEVELTDIKLDVKFKLNGWRSLGCVQRKDGIVQCYFEDNSLIEQYKNTLFQCEHCRKKIFRNSAVVLENESHERKVVGTSCVKEFTSGLDGNLIAEVNEYTNRLRQFQVTEDNLQFRDDIRSHCRLSGVVTYDVLSVISTAKRVIDRYGFEPSSSDNATWKLIKSEYSTRIEDEALQAIEWIRSLDESVISGSCYLFNLKQVIDANYCTSRHFGLLASIIPSYRKSLSEKLTELISEHVGAIGDKLTVTVKYIKTFWYETAYGTSYVHIFSDDNGNIFKWSTGKSIVVSDGSRIPEGSIVNLTGRVKAHDEYRNQKQTVLTRCKYSTPDQ